MNKKTVQELFFNLIVCGLLYFALTNIGSFVVYGIDSDVKVEWHWQALYIISGIIALAGFIYRTRSMLRSR